MNILVLKTFVDDSLVNTIFIPSSENKSLDIFETSIMTNSNNETERDLNGFKKISLDQVSAMSAHQIAVKITAFILRANVDDEMH